MYHAPAFDPAQAAAIAAIAMGSLLAAVILAAPAGLLPATLAGQLALAAVPIAAAVIASRRGASVRDLLGLRAARAKYVGAAALLGCTAWYVNLRVVALLPLPEGKTRELAQLVEAPPTGAALLAIALAPAICEELLFRGVLARSLARSSAILGVVASSLAFSLYHLSIVQAVPTLLLGAAFALIAIRSGSVLPTTLAHLLNNAIAILLTRDELPAVTAWFDAHPDLALAGGLAGVAAALAVAGGSRGIS